jgi:hypothetical protein
MGGGVAVAGQHGAVVIRGSIGNRDPCAAATCVHRAWEQGGGGGGEEKRRGYQVGLTGSEENLADARA